MQQPNLYPSAAAAPAHGGVGTLHWLQTIPSPGVSTAGGMGSLQPTSRDGADDDVFERTDSDARGSGSDDCDSGDARTGSAGTSARLPWMRMRTRGAGKPRPPTPLPVGRRKLGRPIMFTGDPEDPSLTNDERRRIRRRTANRASAQRVRERRTQQASLLVNQLSDTEAMRDELHGALVRTQAEVQHLTMALQQASQGWVAESAKGSRLQSQLASVASSSMLPRQPALQMQLPLGAQHWAPPPRPWMAVLP